MCAAVLADALFEVFLPAECPCCRGALSAGAKALCAGCRASLVPLSGFRCYRCGGPADSAEDPCLACVGDPPAQTATVAWGEHGGTLRQAILALKHRGHDELAPLLASRLASRVAVEPWASRIDLVTSVPSHPLFRLRRGWSAAEMLARAAAAHLALPYRRTLRRHGFARQATRTRAERVRLPAKHFSPTHPESVRERSVLLIDDVMTTGTTLRHASRRLLGAGASAVYVAALAAAEDPRSIG